MSKEQMKQEQRKSEQTPEEEPTLSVYTAEEYGVSMKLPMEKLYILKKLNVGKILTAEQWKKIVSNL